ncbi:MAG: hypothetical protein LKE96_08550 [Acetobacter peroxydans]|nr:hypothetical protein [Acetobacter peroxydans]
MAEGMVAGLVGSLALVTLWLTLAVRSWRVVVPIVITLVVGLLLTTGFAAVAGWHAESYFCGVCYSVRGDRG